MAKMYIKPTWKCLGISESVNRTSLGGRSLTMLTTLCPLLTTYLVDIHEKIPLLLEGKTCVHTVDISCKYNLPTYLVMSTLLKNDPFKEKRGLSLWQFLVRPTTLSTWLNVEKVEKSRCFWQYGKCSQSNMLWIFFSSWKHSCEIVGPNKKWLKKENRFMHK